MDDSRLHAVREALAAYASDPDDPPPGPDIALDAAVALVLRGQPDDLEVLLIKRAANPRDPWSGHMALPGGRREPTDTSLVHTAVRETQEETGVILPPETGVAFGHLGPLPRVAPQSGGLPRLRISPYVFGVPADTDARAASPEVARVHWTPLALLQDPAVHDEVEMALPRGPRVFPALRVHDEVVWGLTYRILRDFLGRLEPR